MSLIELYEYLQVLFSFYLVVLVIRHKYPFKILLLFVATSLLFLGLKLRLIPYELGGVFNRFLWGSFNIMQLTCIAYIIVFDNAEKVWKSSK